MSSPVIKRYIPDEEAFEAIKSDFGFLVKRIKISGFEYDLQIRDGYFNLYYKGNSIGKILYKKPIEQYEVSIHSTFVHDRIKKRFNPVSLNNYLIFKIPRKQLHPLFSSQNLNSMASKVKKNNFQEEIIYEQMLMTDNVNRDDLIIIDRQVMDKVSKTKMDLLTLKRKENSNYQFCVVEVKLGNNPELEGEVIKQLKGYVKMIEDNFNDYRECYEKNFKQKRKLGTLAGPDSINIVPDVSGVVVVMGYSELANKSIDKLGKKDESIKVIQFKNWLNIKELD
ncbi:MAG: hypothetical protein L6263_00535 [Desulfobacteraceae bacterium]|nr:hypothetical protein [Desulfobacteraceae bacterium]MBU4126708.1 hypothetical protein [Pseudomonadota bacterium]MCG2756907.1 hypothetical protein [Desulfobacteraceae bacterium]MCG2829865.1 hypothetical protein [Desulfobacteraceae bacterium]